MPGPLTIFTGKKLNHLNLVVPDVAAARQLSETHFGSQHQLTRGASAPAILEGADGFVLVLANGVPSGAYPNCTALDGLLIELRCHS